MVCAALALRAGRPAIGRQQQSAASESSEQADARLAKAWRFERGGWIFVHLEGKPEDVGYQHGALLAPEIEDAFTALKAREALQAEWDPGPNAELDSALIRERLRAALSRRGTSRRSRTLTNSRNFPASQESSR